MKYHRAKLINEAGDIVPLCRVVSMKKINLKVECWTIRDDAVTCPRCAALLAIQRPNEALADRAMIQESDNG